MENNNLVQKKKRTITTQSLFNKVLNALEKQGWQRSMSPSSKRCMYRGKDGCKCAVGHLIPDENYHRQLEGKLSNNAEVLAAIPYELTEYQIRYVRELQRFHDTFLNPNDPNKFWWANARLNGLASVANVKVPKRILTSLNRYIERVKIEKTSQL